MSVKRLQSVLNILFILCRNMSGNNCSLFESTGSEVLLGLNSVNCVGEMFFFLCLFFDYSKFVCCETLTRHSQLCMSVWTFLKLKNSNKRANKMKKKKLNKIQPNL